jgi:hypothetical protein
LNAGTYSELTATFNGDEDYLASVSPSQSLVVTKAATLVRASVPASGTVTFGDSVPLSATVTSPGGMRTGAIRFFDNGLLLGSAPLDHSGKAVLITPSIGPGARTITAYYLGDSNFLASDPSQALALNVLPAPAAANVNRCFASSLRPASDLYRNLHWRREYRRRRKWGYSRFQRRGNRSLQRGARKKTRPRGRPGSNSHCSSRPRPQAVAGKKCGACRRLTLPMPSAWKTC